MYLLGISEVPSEGSSGSSWWEEGFLGSESRRSVSLRDNTRSRYRQAKFWEDDHLGGPVSLCARNAAPAARLDRDRALTMSIDAGDPFSSEPPESRDAGRERSVSMLDITRYLKLSGTLYDGQDKRQRMVMPAKRIFPGVRSLVEWKSEKS